MKLTIRKIKEEDCSAISAAFAAQEWNKPVGLYRQYFRYQQSGERDILFAEYNGRFAAYLTINWQSDYLPFQEKGIPEIVDFNVLQKFQRRGIGTSLMEEAEQRIKRVSNYAGLGVGVTADYGPAHILYAKRNYIPDGRGLIKGSETIKYGTNILVDDGLVLYMIKDLTTAV